MRGSGPGFELTAGLSFGVSTEEGDFGLKLGGSFGFNWRMESQI